MHAERGKSKNERQAFPKQICMKCPRTEIITDKARHEKDPQSKRVREQIGDKALKRLNVLISWEL